MKSRHAVMPSLLVAISLMAGLQATYLVAQQESEEGVFFVQNLSEMELTGEFDSPFNRGFGNLSFWTNAWFTRVVLDQAGDAFVQLDRDTFGRAARRWNRDQEETVPALAIRLDEPAAEVTGTIYFPDKRGSPLRAYLFSIREEQFTAEKTEFLRVQYRHYSRLWNASLVGAAWFRHRSNELADQIGIEETAEDDDERTRARRRRVDSDLERSLSLISGGTALSENLQLDRMLNIGAGDDEASIDVDEISGITVNEFDWRPLVRDINPQLDALAQYIPADQHAMFVPSFESLVTLIETGFKTAGPLLPLMDDSGASANTRQRYQDQLGLPLGQVQKLFGPKLIDSIAITGGDPYFRTGTDVAVLFEAKDPAALSKAIETTVKMSGARYAKLEEVNGNANDIEYIGFQTPDRTVSSFIAIIGNAVLVTNSTEQLERIARVINEESDSLADLDEFRFFRDRYQPGDERETALVIISDATIRRWCSPRWRIATSRRTRAAAVLADLHAEHMSDLVNGIESPINVEVGSSAFALNEFVVADHAAMSPTVGTLAFQTPINEMEIQEVSGRERDAYEQWRRGYESNWSTAFDPIAIQLFLDEGKLAVDMTVMPLIDNSEYDLMADVSMGVKLDPKRNFRHTRALAWFALSLNSESERLKQFGNMSSTFARVNFMDWLGDAAIVYVDDDPLWKEMEGLEAKKFAQQEFLEENLHRLPVALQFNVRSSIKLTAFLVGLRGFVEQSAPDLTVWETLRHREKAYVKVGPSAESRQQLPDENIALYYFASGDTLVFSLSETVIQHTIDRQVDGSKKASDEAPAKNADSLALLGENFAVHLNRSLAVGAVSFFNDDYQQRMQRKSWSVLPILNEWKRMFPDREPLAVDRLVWNRELICPGGGEYRWNDQARTMESSVFGHPGDPKPGPHVAQLLGDWAFGDFGLTFENQGLRARLELDEGAPQKE